MKKLIQLSIVVWLLCQFSACKEKSTIIPEFTSIPEVNYLYESKTHDSIKKMSVFINSFYISNEITNRQYREFTDWAKNHPEETLSKVKEIVVRKYSESGKKLVYNLPWSAKVSDLLPNLIDSNAIYKLDKRLKNYFTDPRFDDYPVVGVSKNAAEYYCIWLRRVEAEYKTERVKVKGEKVKIVTSSNTVLDYRLPSELEWQHVSNHQNKRKLGNDYKLNRVTDGASNWEGVFHINDNVSEWVTSERDTLALGMGENWFQKGIALDQFWLHPDSSNGYTGFRIAATHNPETKKNENK
jgi:formylglycine-generating enzyme required for sulfatase activity